MSTLVVAGYALCALGAAVGLAVLGHGSQVAWWLPLGAFVLGGAYSFWACERLSGQHG